MKATIKEMKDYVEAINERITELGDKRRLVLRRRTNEWAVQVICSEDRKIRFDMFKANQQVVSVWLSAYYRGLLMPRTVCPFSKRNNNA